MFVELSSSSLRGAILSVTLAAVEPVPMLSTSFVSNELDPALWLSGLFS